MHPLRHLLWPLAIVYGLAVSLRNLLFDLGIFHTKRYDVPIICVGNLEAGGTGKSPLVQYICGLLLEKGFRVAMLSRGYGRTTKGFLIVNASSSATETGDEPLQAKLRFPKLTVAVCENRRKGIGSLLSGETPPDVIVLDDAFQHRWVKPSLSILTTPSEQPFWENHLLPVGTLRESASGSNRADMLVMTGKENRTVKDFHADVFSANVESEEPVAFNKTDSILKPTDRVLLFSGIARSERFKQTVAEQFQVVGHHKFSDHHDYSESDMLMLRNAFHSFAPPINGILTTTKDAARLHNTPIAQHLKDVPLFALPIQLKWAAGDREKFNQKIIAHVSRDKGNR